MLILNQSSLIPDRVCEAQFGISNGLLGIGIDTNRLEFSIIFVCFLVIFGGFRGKEGAR